MPPRYEQWESEFLRLIGNDPGDGHGEVADELPIELARTNRGGRVKL